jgi:hypothetical protein
MYQIRFTQDGQQVQIWTGYASHGDAWRAIKDSDSLIPFRWEYVIEAQPHPALMGNPQ